MIFGASLGLACSDDAPAETGGGGSSTGGAGEGGGPVGGAPAGGNGEGGGGGEGGAAPAGPTSIPSYFRLTATAAGAMDDVDVTCSIDFIFELDAETARDEAHVEYPGVHGGEAKRSLLDSTGAGFVFDANSFGDVVATLRFGEGDTGDIDLAIPINETAKNRFWQELALFTGTLSSDGTGGGAWTCAPLDITQDGYVDDTVIVEGTWAMEPVDG